MSSAVVLLGDLVSQKSLHLILAPLVERALPVCFTHGNHDADGSASEHGLNSPTTRWTIDDPAVAQQRGAIIQESSDMTGLGDVMFENVRLRSSRAARQHVKSRCAADDAGRRGAEPVGARTGSIEVFGVDEITRLQP